jgi:hypothetical protein
MDAYSKALTDLHIALHFPGSTAPAVHRKILSQCAGFDRCAAQYPSPDGGYPMIRHSRPSAVLSTLAFTLWICCAIGVGSIAAADDAPPPSAPGNDGSGRHHNPAWAACKKQADDQKLQPGDARRDFMKNCLKSAHGAAPATS